MQVAMRVLWLCKCECELNEHKEYGIRPMSIIYLEACVFRQKIFVRSCSVCMRVRARDAIGMRVCVREAIANNC